MICASGADSSASADGKPSTRTAASFAYTRLPSGPWAVTESAMPSRIARRSSATRRSPSCAARSSVTSSKLMSSASEPSGAVMGCAVARSVRSPRGVSQVTIVPRTRSPRAARREGSASSASGRPSASRQEPDGIHSAAERPTGPASPVSASAARLANSTRALPGSTITTDAGRASSSSRGHSAAAAIAADADSPLIGGSLIASIGGSTRGPRPRIRAGSPRTAGGGPPRRAGSR